MMFRQEDGSLVWTRQAQLACSPNCPACVCTLVSPPPVPSRRRRNGGCARAHLQAPGVVGNARGLSPEARSETLNIYIYATPTGLSTLFGHFWVEMTEVAHCPGCDASRPIRGECLVDAKARRELGLAPCPQKSPKAIHTLGVVVCRIINYQGTLISERGTTYATPSLKDQTLTVSCLHCFKNSIERVLTVGAPF